MLEIGCGDGFFLNEIFNYCRNAIGFEPFKTYKMAESYKGLKIFNEYFDPYSTVINEKISLFILRHVLEHIEQPLPFVGALNGLYSRDAEFMQNLFIEVPNASYLLENNMYFDFYYDHIFYFTDISLIYLLKKSGWNKIINIGDKYDEFLTLLCQNKEAISSDNRIDTERVKMIEKTSNVFSKMYAAWNKKLAEILLEIKGKGRKIAVWGAGSRGVTFLTVLCRERNFFDYVVDSDPNKKMLYIPVLGIQVFNPDIIAENPVDYILITAYTYFDEICSTLSKFRKNGLKIIKVYPDIEII